MTLTLLDCYMCGHSREEHSIGKPAVCNAQLGSDQCICTEYISPVSKHATLNNNVDPIEEHIYGIIRALGLDPTSEGLADTPRRVADYLREFVHPEVDLPGLLKNGFDNPAGATGAMVVQVGIPFRGCCEHHLLPFHGSAAIGYIPKGRIVGLSKLTRLVQGAGTRKPSTQEEISNTIADILDSHLQPVGVIVFTEATHTCMAVRGVNAPNVTTKVSAIRGVYRDVPSARSEFFSLLTSQ